MSERWEWACPECGHVNVVAEVIDAVLWCERCVVPPASDENEEG